MSSPRSPVPNPKLVFLAAMIGYGAFFVATTLFGVGESDVGTAELVSLDDSETKPQRKIGSTAAGADKIPTW